MRIHEYLSRRQQLFVGQEPTSTSNGDRYAIGDFYLFVNTSNSNGNDQIKVSVRTSFDNELILETEDPHEAIAVAEERTAKSRLAIAADLPSQELRELALLPFVSLKLKEQTVVGEKAFRLCRRLDLPKYRVVDLESGPHFYAVSTEFVERHSIPFLQNNWICIPISIEQIRPGEVDCLDRPWHRVVLRLRRLAISRVEELAGAYFQSKEG